MWEHWHLFKKSSQNCKFVSVKWVLSPQYGVSSSCGQRRHPPNMEGSYKYTE